LSKERRTDAGTGDILPERRGADFFPYKPPHLAASAPRSALARATNAVQEILASGQYDGAIWTRCGAFSSGSNGNTARRAASG